MHEGMPSNKADNVTKPHVPIYSRMSLSQNTSFTLLQYVNILGKIDPWMAWGHEAVAKCISDVLTIALWSKWQTSKLFVNKRYLASDHETLGE